jgi:hypothetical protein
VPVDGRDLLSVLRIELAFLDEGGYSEPSAESWRPRFYLEDSPSCMNLNARRNPAPCVKCVLAPLVPARFLEEASPCRHIPLNEHGETLDSLYRHSHGHEIEEALREWLESTIEDLERKRGLTAPDSASTPVATAESLAAVRLFEHGRTKCANPECSHPFHWLGGGRFFQFNLSPPPPSTSARAAGSASGHRSGEHYWLCEPCSILYTLHVDRERGVRVAPCCSTRPAAQHKPKCSAA